MRFLPLAAILILMLSGYSTGEELKVIDESRLEERNGLSYELAHETPFTGKIVGKYFDGQSRMECAYKNGKKHGSSTTWYQSGRVRMQSSYKDGKRDGRWIKWTDQGKIQFQRIYRNGMRVN